MKLATYPATVLRLAPQAKEALHGISSQVVTASYNAFLDKQGRIIATVAQHYISDDEIWLVVMHSAQATLLAHLQKMLMFASTQIETLSKQIYFDLELKPTQLQGAVMIPQKAGRLWITDDALTSSVSADEFLNFRLHHGIALHGIDYQQEMLLNITDENYVSYQKGCFLGQEIIARVHYKSRPPKQLVVRYKSELSPDLQVRMTSKLYDPQRDEERGFVFIDNKGSKA